MRSQFSTRTRILAFTLALVTLATGCNSNTVLAYLQAIAPSAIAVLNLVAAFQGTSASSGVIQNVTSESAAVIDLFKKWQAASDAAKPDAKSQFDAAFATFQANVAEILATAKVGDPAKQAKVDAIVAALAVLIAQTEALVTANGSQVKALRRSGQFYDSPSAFQKDFDKKLAEAKAAL